jgi:hypothetical protein
MRSCNFSEIVSGQLFWNVFDPFVKFSFHWWFAKWVWRRVKVSVKITKTISVTWKHTCWCCILKGFILLIQQGLRIADFKVYIARNIFCNRTPNNCLFIVPMRSCNFSEIVSGQLFWNVFDPFVKFSFHHGNTHVDAAYSRDLFCLYSKD